MDRAPGLSVRLKLTLSYAGLLMLAGASLLAAVRLFLPRRMPPGSAFSFLLRDFTPIAAILLAFLLVFGLLGGWILAGRMLAPLSRIMDATRMAANGSLAHRIRLPGRRDEFRELADSFDAMLARLEAHVAEQQRFAANASHELRTPLAITQTLLDVARNDPNRDNSELDDRLRAVNARAIDLTEALLLLSRADQRSFTREHVDLSLIAEEATEALLPLAEKRGVTIETSGDITPTIGSGALLLQMTTNLVHNAIVHNLPQHGTVSVTTGVHPKTVTLTVENTGEKLTPHLVSALVEPFQRGTERIRNDHAGVGLGLAIVKSITQAHEGTLAITPRTGGGLQVTVQLPAAPTHTGGLNRPGFDAARDCHLRLPAARLSTWRAALSTKPGNLGHHGPGSWAIARSAPPGLSAILGTKVSSAPEETTMMHTTAQALGRAHLADLHRQAQRDALTRAARKARRARRQEPGHRTPGILAAVTAWAHRPGPAPESS